MTDDTLVLAGEFDKVSYETWKSSLEKVLKGASFEKKLVTKTLEGIDIQPLYTKADWSGESNASGFPGAAPFTRGNTASGRSVSGWDIRQLHAHPDPKKANENILEDLARGVTSIILKIDPTGKAGVVVRNLADLEVALNGVDLAQTPVSLAAGANAGKAADVLMQLWAKKGVSGKGALNLDPIGTLAATGSLPVSLFQALSDAAELAKKVAGANAGVTTLAVDTSVYYGAGATETQDLACALAGGVAYLRALTNAGLDIDTACTQIAFNFATGADFFPAIAKLRAARRLWAVVAKECGASEKARAMILNAGSAERALSKRDPWVNMLRTTATCFAGAIAGANSITVLPYDHQIGLPGPLSRRIARNTQIILQEESSLNRVIDPAGGSYYIETLTDQLCERAWPIFQEIEEKGGLVAVLSSGWLQEEIAKAWDARVQLIATRKEPLTGVSEFPNVFENDVDCETPDLDAVLAASAGRGDAVITPVPTVTGAVVKALPAHRLAEDFEALRDRADAMKAKTGKRPQIFLANLGRVAQHTARATYAKNYFEAGGIEAISTNGFDDADACAAAFKESGAKVAIICGGDDQYEAQACDVAKALKAANCQKVYLAGRGGAIEEQLNAAGVDAYIYAGSDVLAALRALHAELGV